LIPARQKAGIFAPHDIKILFANAESVVETSDAFLRDIKKGVEEDMIGDAFHQHVQFSFSQSLHTLN
jgi:hypothetical protein